MQSMYDQRNKKESIGNFISWMRRQRLFSFFPSTDTSMGTRYQEQLQQPSCNEETSRMRTKSQRTKAGGVGGVGSTWVLDDIFEQ